jgi:predicted aminopeptidase
MQRLLTIILLCMPLTGCYYLQAASGQWEVLRKREPLNEVIEDSGTSPELAARLKTLNEARDFSIADLGLPDNRSYRSFTALDRDFVVWNVFAAPEFSLKAKQWCYPIAGCVSYRGYFSKKAAIRESQRLAADGYDVAVGGVAAYSTLGKFSDPILSTMLRWGDVDLVAVLFHELAHQVVYVKDDSSFNESFATAVEEIGVKRWLAARGEVAKMDDYLARRKLQQSLLVLVATARVALGSLYESDIAVEQKRVRKRALLQKLADDAAAEVERSGEEGSAWLSGELNNARLISMTLYEGRLPSFRALYARCNKSLECFYAEARKLAEMDFETREAALTAGDLLRFGRGSDER